MNVKKATEQLFPRSGRLYNQLHEMCLQLGQQMVDSTGECHTMGAFWERDKELADGVKHLCMLIASGLDEDILEAAKNG